MGVSGGGLCLGVPRWNSWDSWEIAGGKSESSYKEVRFLGSFTPPFLVLFGFPTSTPSRATPRFLRVKFDFFTTSPFLRVKGRS